MRKDPAKAKAAGLVQPDAAYCGNCHKRKWDSALLGEVHAHKEASSRVGIALDETGPHATEKAARRRPELAGW